MMIKMILMPLLTKIQNHNKMISLDHISGIRNTEIIMLVYLRKLTNLGILNKLWKKLIMKIHKCINK
jgi:hypothetical protein